MGIVSSDLGGSKSPVSRDPGLALNANAIVDRFKALSKQSTSNSWYKVITDQTTNEYTYSLLQLLPDCVIRSLIRNTLAYDYHYDKRVKHFVDHRMKTTTPYAGIYVNICTLAPSPSYKALLMTAQSARDGRWLSSRQVEHFISRAERYMANTPSYWSENFKVDSKFSGRSQPIQERKWRVNDKWTTWLERLREQYSTNIEPSKVSQPIQELSYGGWMVG